MSTAETPEDLDVSIEHHLPIRQLLPSLLQARLEQEVICNFAPLPMRVF
jgi:hypothetical protein